jgi:cbb3-type cytochrome oxidase subunit 3
MNNNSIYKIATQKILKDKKTLSISVLFSFFLLIIFFYFSNFSQFNQVLSLDLSLGTKVSAFFEIILESFKVMPNITFTLYIIWMFLFFIFNAVFVFLWKQKKKNIEQIAQFEGELKTKSSSGKLAFLSSVFSFLGFGCIACGQTILLSIFTLFFSASANLVYTAGNMILFLGILLLIYVIRKDLKQIYLDKMCEI